MKLTFDSLSYYQEIRGQAGLFDFRPSSFLNRHPLQWECVHNNTKYMGLHCDVLSKIQVCFISDQTQEVRWRNRGWTIATMLVEFWMTNGNESKQTTIGS